MKFNVISHFNSKLTQKIFHFRNGALNMDVTDVEIAIASSPDNNFGK